MTYVLIHGAGGSAWSWHLVVDELARRGHEAVAVDLPCDDDSAGLPEYVEAAMEAIGDRTHLTVVAHSLGAFTATLLCDRVPVELLVLVAAMVPAPGGPPGAWWGRTRWAEARQVEIDRYGDSDEATFLHDVPPALAAGADARDRIQSGELVDHLESSGTNPRVGTSVRYDLAKYPHSAPARYSKNIS